MMLASSSELRIPSRSGRCRRMPMPPDSSPPIRMSRSSIRSQMYLKPMPHSCILRPYLAEMRSIIRVVLKARTTSPGHCFRFSSHSRITEKILCESTNLPSSATAPSRSASPSVTSPAWQCSRTTVSCKRATCGSIGSGLIPGNSGFSSPRISMCSMPFSVKMWLNTPRPEPYIASTANLNPAFLIASRSTNFLTAATYGVLKSAALTLPPGRSIHGASSAPSIDLMMAGVAEPP